MIASERGEVGLAAGIDLLRAGASAMDAVEAAIRLVESDEENHTVGVGGMPNLLGEVELDASVMDGATRRAGAVAAVADLNSSLISSLISPYLRPLISPWCLCVLFSTAGRILGICSSRIMMRRSPR